MITGKPTKPKFIEVVCKVTRAEVQWMSLFNGGNTQLFSVVALNGHHKESIIDTIADKGENKIHVASLQNLQPSTTYVFYISAKNSFGNSSSDNISCMTLEGKIQILLLLCVQNINKYCCRSLI